MLKAEHQRNHFDWRYRWILRTETMILLEAASMTKNVWCTLFSRTVGVNIYTALLPQVWGFFNVNSSMAQKTKLERFEKVISKFNYNSVFSTFHIPISKTLRPSIFQNLYSIWLKQKSNSNCWGVFEQYYPNNSKRQYRHLISVDSIIERQVVLWMHWRCFSRN